uniref:Uncharacterized protein n=1 Tax=Arundo donax TaxID=35708 RepID=A0A0A9DQW5_ARUDO
MVLCFRTDTLPFHQREFMIILHVDQNCYTRQFMTDILYLVLLSPTCLLDFIHDGF